MSYLTQRRRALLIGTIKNQEGGYVVPQRGQYAVTSEDNPDWMSFLYQNGVAANPNYCTFEEAAAVENFSGMTQIPVSHVDLRYFTGVNLTSTYSLDTPISIITMKLTLPDVSGAWKVGGNAKFISRDTPPYTLVIPANVEHFSANCINAGYTHAIYIFEGSVPPSHDWTSYLKNNGGGGSLDAIYVPNNAVNTYKTTSIHTGNTNWKEYAQYADIIFPHSAYLIDGLCNTDDWVFGYRFNTIGQTAQASCCITTMIPVNVGDSIRTCIPESGDANLGVFGYANESDTGSWILWAERGDRNGGFTIPSGVNFIRVSLFINRLESTFLFNNTTGKFLYKGINV